MNICEENIATVISDLLPEVSPKDICISPIRGGRNNRAYCVILDGNKYFLKHYNKSEVGSQGRLKTEYQFLSYAAQCECQYVAKTIAYNESLSIAIYEYIAGSRYQKGELQQQDIEEALRFLVSINKNRFSKAAKKLSPASEACFSIEEHIQRVDARVERLSAIQIYDKLDEKVLAFVKKELLPAWSDVKKKFFNKARKLKIDIDYIITEKERIISPSDFGFHNALKLQNGQIKFVDFEYAGWDDPAKLVGDFFNQIEVPVSLKYLVLFIETLAEIVANEKAVVNRIHILLPVYRIKWVCLVLNYFLPQTRQIKNFVAQVTQFDRIVQLDKAKNILYALRDLDSLTLGE